MRVDKRHELYYAAWERGETRSSFEGWLCEQLDTLEAALREARPYVFNRIDPPGHSERDWRSETAEDVLERVDAALGR